MACGDLDGDGGDEAVVGQMNGDGSQAFSTLFQTVDLARDADGNLVVLRRRGPVPAVQRAFRGLGGVNLAVGDVDGDGNADIIAAVAGDPDGANNPALKNFFRVFKVTVDDQNRIASIKAMTPTLRAFGAALNPSGGISVAAVNLDDDEAAEIVVGTQGIVTLDTTTGDVTVTEPAPAAAVRGIKVEFDADGNFTGVSAATPRVTAFGDVNKPTSGAVNVQVYPAQ